MMKTHVSDAACNNDFEGFGSSCKRLIPSRRQRRLRNVPRISFRPAHMAARQHPRLFNQPREINVEICLDAGARTFRASITQRPTGSARAAASLVGARLARRVKRFAKMPLRRRSRSYKVIQSVLYGRWSCLKRKLAWTESTKKKKSRPKFRLGAHHCGPTARAAVDAVCLWCLGSRCGLLLGRPKREIGTWRQIAYLMTYTPPSVQIKLSTSLTLGSSYRQSKQFMGHTWVQEAKT